MLPLLFRWHRRLGAIIALPLLLWSFSGVLHPLMSRMNPQPVAMGAPLATLPDSALQPGLALQQAGIGQVRALRLVQLGERHFYQVLDADGSVQYVDVRSGALLQQGDAAYAKLLALHFSGRMAEEVISVTRISQFDEDYLWINRLLPVWRVNFSGDDRLALYVETAPARLAAMVNDTRRFNSALFNALHKWQIFPSHLLLTLLMAMLLLLSATVALGGVLLYGFLWRNGGMQRRAQRRAQLSALQSWHRRTGLGISLFALLFTLSGVYHLLHESSPMLVERVPLPLWPVSALHGLDIHGALGHDSAAVLTGCEFSVCRLTAPAAAARREHDHAAPAQTAADFALTALAGDQRADLHAFAIAAGRQALGLPAAIAPATVTIIDHFAGEYGFLNKRLPVLRVEFASDDGATAYWEPGTGAIAAVVRNRDRYEGNSFGFLHKFHWLDFAGKNARDAVAALAALLVGLVTLLGVMLWMRKIRG